MKKERLKGHSPSAYDINMCLFGQGDPDIPNFTQEQKAKLFRAALPDNLPTVKGSIIIMGTGGEIDGSNGFKDLWDEKK